MNTIHKIVTVGLIVGLMVVTPSVSAAKWNELVGEDGLAKWRPGKHKDNWFAASKVWAPDRKTKKLLTKPGKGVIVNGKRGRTRNLYTKNEFGDIEARVEFMVPKNSNSGIYFMGRYEIQILDSYGKKKVKHGDCGGIYQRWDPKRGRGKEGFEGHPPRVNASRAPGEWQTFEVIFLAPRFDKNGKKIRNAKFVRVVHNGKVVHENVEVTGPTRAAGYRGEKPKGPIMVQGDHGPVALRSLKVRSISKSAAKAEAPVTPTGSFAGRTVAEWAKELNGDHRVARLRAANALAVIGDPAGEELVAMLTNKDAAVRYWGAVGLGARHGALAQYHASLVKAMKDESYIVRIAAAYALRGSRHQSSAIALLTEGLKVERRGFANVAADYLGLIGKPAKSSIPALKKLAKNRDYHLRNAANLAIKRIGG